MLAGDPQDIIGAILERRDRLGIDELVVPAEIAGDFLPVLRGLGVEPVRRRPPGDGPPVVAGLSVRLARAHTGTKRPAAGDAAPNR